MINGEYLRDPGLLICAGEAERTVILFGKEMKVKLLSVYENAVCLKEAAKLGVRLEKEGVTNSGSIAKSAALCSACLFDGLGRVFDSTDEALLRLTADEAAAVCDAYAALRKSELDMMSVENGDIGRLKDAVNNSLLDRIRWKVMRTMNCLPQDSSFKKMTDGQFLFCYVNILADEGDEWERGFNENFAGGERV